MKKYLFLILAAAISFTACEDEAVGPTLEVKNTPVLSAPGGSTSFTLLASQADQLFPAITWTATNYGYNAGVTYVVEMDKAGNNFAEPVTIGTTNGLTLDNLTVGEMNTFLFASKELPGEEASQVELRIKSDVSGEVPTVYSNVITLTITPYTIVVVYPQLQVPGSYQGWNPAENATIIYSAKSNNKYEGFVDLNEANGKFKYTLGPSWATNWGDNGADGTLEPGGADIAYTTPGLYKLNVDLNNLTHTYALTNWGVIGSATPTGWDSDTDLAYDPATGVLSTTLNLTAGEIKFRANDDWAINLGDDGANRKMEYGGANIVVAEAGNYKIELFLVRQAIYTYKLTKL